MPRFIRRLLEALLNWDTRRLDKLHEQKMRKAFPIGERVRLTAGCNCGRKYAGRDGTVVGLTLDASDYKVNVDGDSDSYQFVCAKGMVRV